MKRKIATTLTAVTLCTAMLGSTALASSFDGQLDEDVLAAGGVEVEGDSTVENPAYKIVVPTQLDFAVDPFEQRGQSQIYSKDFYMVNKSNVPVQLDCTVTLEAATGVTIKDNADDVKETDDSKLIYMEAEIPGAVDGTDATAAAAYETPIVKSSTTGKYYTSAAVPDDVSDAAAATEMIDTTDAKGTYTTNKKIALGTTAKSLSFALEKAEYVEYYTAKDLSTTAKQFKAVAANNAGNAAFRFSGKVNTKATWADAAIKAKVKYTFNGLTGTNYTDLTATPVANAHAYIEGDKNIVESDGTNDIVIYYTGTQPQSVTLTPVQTTGTATSAMTKSNGSEVVIDSEKVTFKAAFLNGIIKNTQRGKGTYKVTIGTTDTTVTLK